MRRECADFRCWVAGDKDVEESGDVGGSLVGGNGLGLRAGQDESRDSA